MHRTATGSAQGLVTPQPQLTPICRSYHELFHLNEVEADIIATLVPRQQFLLKQPGVAKVLNLQVDAESARLFSVGRRGVANVLSKEPLPVGHEEGAPPPKDLLH
jgi:hypothetical protein